MPILVDYASAVATATLTLRNVALPKNAIVKRIVSRMEDTSAMYIFYVAVGKYTSDPGYSVPYLVFLRNTYAAGYIFDFCQNMDVKIVDGQLTIGLYHTAGADKKINTTIFYEVEK